MPIAVASVFLFLATLVSLYSMVIFVRIIMTWIPGAEYGQIGDALRTITDPFLNLFKRFSFLRVGYVDFSVLGAFIALNILSSILQYIGRTGTFRVGIVLAIIVQTLGSAAGFILWLLLFVVLFRLIGLYLRLNSMSRVWYSLDNFLQPLVHPIIRKLFPTRIIPYGTTLLGFGGGLLLSIVVLRIVAGLLVMVLQRIPF